MKGEEREKAKVVTSAKMVTLGRAVKAPVGLNLQYRGEGLILAVICHLLSLFRR